MLVASLGCVTVGRDGQLERSAAGNAVASLLIPGLGQFMNGQPGKGALMMAINIGNNVLWANRTDFGGTGYVSESERMRFLVIGAGVMVWSGADAARVARHLNETNPLPGGGGARGVQGVAPEYDPPFVVAFDPLGKRISASLCLRF